MSDYTPTTERAYMRYRDAGTGEFVTNAVPGLPKAGV